MNLKSRVKNPNTITLLFHSKRFAITANKNHIIFKFYQVKLKCDFSNFLNRKNINYYNSIL